MDTRIQGVEFGNGRSVTASMPLLELLFL